MVGAEVIAVVFVAVYLRGMRFARLWLRSHDTWWINERKKFQMKGINKQKATTLAATISHTHIHTQTDKMPSRDEKS